MNEQRAKLIISKSGAITYQYVDDLGGECIHHQLGQVEIGLRGAYVNMLARKTDKVAYACSLPFWPFAADYRVCNQADVLIESMRTLSGDPGPWTYTSDNSFWYVIHSHSYKAYCIGRIGGPRGKGTGINYRDRARERAIALNAAEMSYYATMRGELV